MSSAKPPLACLQTFAFQGIAACPVSVQVQIAAGMPGFQIVGLADKAVGESRERIRGCFYNLGLALPTRRLTVNLAPADLQKEGSHYDLPIALGLLVCMGTLPQEAVEGYTAMGELGLDGTLTAVAGVLPAAMAAAAEGKGLICPAACMAEARWSGNTRITAARDLGELIAVLRGERAQTGDAPMTPEDLAAAGERPKLPDIADIRGQTAAKRALEVAAAGGHNLLMSGPPGTGKSMLASRLPTILPPLSPQEALEATVIHSIAGLLPKSGLIRERPLRTPHHSASLPAMTGGGARGKPGEISLSHHGVLFLDELAEFPRIVLEALRQPLEAGEITVSRVNRHITYPARVQLVAAMNPCRCGFLGQQGRQCRRAPVCAQDYQSKISGPLLDRFDLRISMPAPSYEDLRGTDPASAGPTSREILSRVTAARERQFARQGISCLNAVIGAAQLKEVCTLDCDGEKLMEQAYARLRLSGRAYHRVLRVARTIADLEGIVAIGAAHIAEALQYRGREFQSA